MTEVMGRVGSKYKLLDIKVSMKCPECGDMIRADDCQVKKSKDKTGYHYLYFMCRAVEYRDYRNNK